MTAPRRIRPRTAALTGSVAGAALGALFGIAVVSFADCAGPNCASERIVGVIAHAAAGAGGGAAAGLLVWTVGRLLAWLRRS